MRARALGRGAAEGPVTPHTAEAWALTTGRAARRPARCSLPWLSRRPRPSVPTPAHGRTPSGARPHDCAVRPRRPALSLGGLVRGPSGPAAPSAVRSRMTSSPQDGLVCAGQRPRPPLQTCHSVSAAGPGSVPCALAFPAQGPPRLPLCPGALAGVRVRRVMSPGATSPGAPPQQRVAGSGSTHDDPEDADTLLRPDQRGQTWRRRMRLAASSSPSGPLMSIRGPLRFAGSGHRGGLAPGLSACLLSVNLCVFPHSETSMFNLGNQILFFSIMLERPSPPHDDKISFLLLLILSKFVSIRSSNPPEILVRAGHHGIRKGTPSCSRPHPCPAHWSACLRLCLDWLLWRLQSVLGGPLSLHLFTFPSLFPHLSD